MEEVENSCAERFSRFTSRERKNVVCKRNVSDFEKACKLTPAFPTPHLTFPGPGARMCPEKKAEKGTKPRKVHREERHGWERSGGTRHDHPGAAL